MFGVQFCAIALGVFSYLQKAYNEKGSNCIALHGSAPGMEFLDVSSHDPEHIQSSWFQQSCSGLEALKRWTIWFYLIF